MTTDITCSSRTRGVLALAVLALPTLLVAVDISVLAVALPTMGRELHASATELLWMTDSYNFMVAGAMLTTGAIADRIGRRRMILVCAAIFAVASGIGAFATTPGAGHRRPRRDGARRLGDPAGVDGAARRAVHRREGPDPGDGRDDDRLPGRHGDRAVRRWRCCSPTSGGARSS